MKQRVTITFDVDPPTWWPISKVALGVAEKVESISGQFSSEGGQMAFASMKVEVVDG